MVAPNLLTAVDVKAAGLAGIAGAEAAVAVAPAPEVEAMRAAVEGAGVGVTPANSQGFGGETPDIRDYRRKSVESRVDDWSGSFSRRPKIEQWASRGIREQPVERTFATVGTWWEDFSVIEVPKQTSLNFQPPTFLGNLCFGKVMIAGVRVNAED